MINLKRRASAPLKLLTMVWNHMHDSTSHSWLKWNHSMADALRLAIRSGMRFDLDDFDFMKKTFRTGYWLPWEEIYSTAVLYRNNSAYLAIEKALDRKPFIVKGASININTGDGPAGNGLARLIVGARFTWNGEAVKVTSFKNRDTVIACSYTSEPGTSCPRCERCYSCGANPRPKITHLYEISHARLRASNKPKRQTQSKGE